MVSGEFKKQLWIVGGSLLGIIVVAFIFVILFRLNINNEVSAIQALQSQKNQSFSSAQEFAVLSDGAKIIRPYESLVSDLMPTKDAVLSVTKSLQTLGSQNGVALTTAFGQEAPANAHGVGSISFSASLNGSGSSIAQFLQAIEKNYFYIVVTSVDVASLDPAKVGKGTLTGKIFFNNNPSSNGRGIFQ